MKYISVGIFFILFSTHGYANDVYSEQTRDDISVLYKNGILYNSDSVLVQKKNEWHKIPKQSRYNRFISYGVSYTLKGRVRADEDERLFLNMNDGREFHLVFKDYVLYKRAEKLALNNCPVHVDGWSIRSDDLTVLKVTRIWKTDVSELDMPEINFLKQQKAAQMINYSNSEIEISNMRWGLVDKGGSDYHWRDAVIRPEKIDKIYMIKRPFSFEPLVAHVIIFFAFKDGGFTDVSGNKSEGFILSVEPVSRHGAQIGLVTGIQRRFNIVWLITTWEDFKYYSQVTISKKLYVHEFNLSKKEKIQFVREALMHATVNRKGEYYHTVTNNCAINPIILLNRILPEDERITLWYNPYLYNKNVFVPVLMFNNLQKIGLLLGLIQDFQPSNLAIQTDEIGQYGRDFLGIDTNNKDIPMPIIKSVPSQ